VSDERRRLASDERALFDWFFARWPELVRLGPNVALDAPVVVYESAEDGYRTLSVPYIGDLEVAEFSSPYSVQAKIEGHPFEALFFVGDAGVMLELIWSAGSWPERLPHPAELSENAS
jgi:hypothetical protein